MPDFIMRFMRVDEVSADLALPFFQITLTDGFNSLLNLW